jgi:hypothetical protein
VIVSTEYDALLIGVPVNVAELSSKVESNDQRYPSVAVNARFMGATQKESTETLNECSCLKDIHHQHLTFSFFKLPKTMEVVHSLVDVLAISWMQLLPTDIAVSNGRKQNEVSVLVVSDNGLF